MVIIGYSLLVFTHSVPNLEKETLMKTIAEFNYEDIVNSSFCRHFSALHRDNSYYTLENPFELLSACNKNLVKYSQHGS